MEDTTKYLIHARIAANGVVERSDVVGAVFGQTEGLLGDELDLRDLQESSKVGRIDVEITSENGQSFGELTIATSLDRAETAILGASLETIDRVGPCRAEIEITEIEDIRAAKRREVVDRAKELLATAFDDTTVSSTDLVADVRDSVRAEEIDTYDGLPAGPSVGSSDAVIVVEGRADVLQLLQYGIKNAVAVEGTDIPETVADLTTTRTTTVFVDGDRGGELILRELLQVGDVDFVAFAPTDRSVEDLSRGEVLTRLRQKVAADRLGDVQNVRETMAGLVDDSNPPMTPESTDEETTADTEVEVVPTSSPAASPSPPGQVGAAFGHSEQTTPDSSADSTPDPPADSTPDRATEPSEYPDGPDQPDASDDAARAASAVDDAGSTASDTAGTADAPNQPTAETGDTATQSTPETANAPTQPPPETDPADSATADETADTAGPATLRDHVDAVIGDSDGTARLLDASFGVQTETEINALIDAIEAAEEPHSLVLDGELSQRVLDAAAQHGVDHIVARSTGEFVKKPVGTRVLTADELDPPKPDAEH
jgi:DNA primase (EC 2.7.7.-)